MRLKKQHPFNPQSICISANVRIEHTALANSTGGQLLRNTTHLHTESSITHIVLRLLPIDSHLYKSVDHIHIDRHERKTGIPKMSTHFCLVSGSPHYGAGDKIDGIGQRRFFRKKLPRRTPYTGMVGNLQGIDLGCS
jgi:hypothetical protein